MTGLLITNKYMTSDKFSILKNGFINASNEMGLKLDYLNNLEAYELLGLSIKYDFILFYDKDLKLAKELENKGYKLFNNSKAIEICDDKYLTYINLKGDIRQPKTIASPFLYYNDLSNDFDFIKKCEYDFSYPFIMKESKGSFGLQVYLINDRNEFIKYLKLVGIKSFLIQEFIKESFGKDIRLQVVGDTVVASIKRINKNGDFKANITNGAEAYIYEATNQEKTLAIKACKIIGVDFAGVDILFGSNNEPILCEINSNAHIENIGKITNMNIYKKILEYIISVL